MIMPNETKLSHQSDENPNSGGTYAKRAQRYTEDQLGVCVNG